MVVERGYDLKEREPSHAKSRWHRHNQAENPDDSSLAQARAGLGPTRVQMTT